MFTTKYVAAACLIALVSVALLLSPLTAQERIVRPTDDRDKLLIDEPQPARSSTAARDLQERVRAAEERNRMEGRNEPSGTERTTERAPRAAEVETQPRAAVRAPYKLTKERLHREAIREKLPQELSARDKARSREIIEELYGVMDAFQAKDLDGLSRHIHPQMIEFDSMSPYRDVGKASFLEHMLEFFTSPEHIEDHYIRIKEPVVQGYGENVAVVSFLYDAEASVSGQFVNNFGKATFVFVRDETLGAPESNSWLLAVCHYSTLRPSLR